MKIRGQHGATKVELQMTAMIDIVFLLLIFFILTFKIVEQEGDFSIRMPLADAAAGPTDDSDLPIKLRLRADSNGHLASISLNENNLGTDFERLRATVLALVGDPSGPPTSGDGPEVEIDTDFNLRYESIVDTITAVSGHKVGNETVTLVQKIKFAPPRRE